VVVVVVVVVVVLLHSQCRLHSSRSQNFLQ